MAIKQDKKNFRKHSERNKELIGKSLDECGVGRSIIIDSQDEIIGGNGVYEQAIKRNIPVKIIESDGSELIAIKRTDLKTGDKKRKLLALADNATSDSSEWNTELLQEEWDLSELQTWDIEIEEVDNCMNDIEIPEEISMCENFIIVCASQEEMQQIQKKFHTEKKKIKFCEVI